MIEAHPLMEEEMGYRTLFSRKRNKAQSVRDLILIFQKPVIGTVIDDGEVAYISIDHFIRPDGMSGINAC